MAFMLVPLRYAVSNVANRNAFDLGTINLDLSSKSSHRSGSGGESVEEAVDMPLEVEDIQVSDFKQVLSNAHLYAEFVKFITLEFCVENLLVRAFQVVFSVIIVLE
jgi:hypothetical protein